MSLAAICSADMNVYSSLFSHLCSVCSILGSILGGGGDGDVWIILPWHLGGGYEKGVVFDDFLLYSLSVTLGRLKPGMNDAKFLGVDTKVNAAAVQKSH